MSLFSCPLSCALIRCCMGVPPAALASPQSHLVLLLLLSSLVLWRGCTYAFLQKGPRSPASSGCCVVSESAAGAHSCRGSKSGCARA